MNTVARRSFIKTAVAGTAVAAIAAMSRQPAAAADAGEVKFAKDLDKLQPGAETAHTPSIAFEQVESKEVAYGKTPAGKFYRVVVQAKHEATEAHHMLGIALYRNGKLVADYSMDEAQPEGSLPAMSCVLRLDAGDELMAVTRCNLHGKWGNRATV